MSTARARASCSDGQADCTWPGSSDDSSTAALPTQQAEAGREGGGSGPPPPPARTTSSSSLRPRAGGGGCNAGWWTTCLGYRGIARCAASTAMVSRKNTDVSASTATWHQAHPPTQHHSDTRRRYDLPPSAPIAPDSGGAGSGWWTPLPPSLPRPSSELFLWHDASRRALPTCPGPRSYGPAPAPDTLTRAMADTRISDRRASTACSAVKVHE